jgi:hypothetical protein
VQVLGGKPQGRVGAHDRLNPVAYVVTFVLMPKPSMCHPDRPMLAKGLCRSCYNKQPGQLARRVAYNRTFVNGQKAKCHPDRPHAAHGLCSPCRNAAYLRSPEGRARSLLGHAKGRAQREGLTFDLEFDDIKIPSNCPLLGIPLDPAADERAPNLPSLDRLDNSKGYVKGNVWVISWRANTLKRDASLAELEAVVEGWRKAKTVAGV